MSGDKKSRRRFIASVGSGLSIGIAGCSGGSSQSKEDTKTASQETKISDEGSTPQTEEATETSTPQPPLDGGMPWISRHGDIGYTRSTEVKFPSEDLEVVGGFGKHSGYYGPNPLVTQNRIAGPDLEKYLVYNRQNEKVFSAKSLPDSENSFIKNGMLIVRPETNLIVGYSLDDGTREFAARPEFEFYNESVMTPTNEGVLIYGKVGYKDYRIEHWDLNGNQTWITDKVPYEINQIIGNPRKSVVYVSRYIEEKDHEYVIAYSLPEGNKKWELEKRANPIAVKDSYLVLANRKYIDGDDKYNGLSVLDIDNQEVVWTGAKSIYSGNPYYSSAKQPAVDGSVIYCCDDETLAAFDYKSDEKIWSKPLASKTVGAPIITKNALLYANDSTVRVLSKEDGSELTTFSPEVRGIVGISVAGDNVYVAGSGGGKIIGQTTSTEAN